MFRNIRFKKSLAILIAMTMLMSSLMFQISVSASDTITHTTTLDPSGFTYDSNQMSLAVNGNSFAMNLSDSSLITYPSMSMTVQVDLDKVPYFGVDVASAGANRSVQITNTADNSTLNYYANAMSSGYEESPASSGLKELDITQASGWSGVVTLRITVYLMYYDGMTKTNSYNKMFFANTTGTNGVGPIDRTTTLDPNGFTYDSNQMSLAVGGNSFAMNLSDSSPITYPSMSMTVQVDLDKVPYFGVDVASAGANRSVQITNTADNSTLNYYANAMSSGYEESPASSGLKELDITQASGWSGVVTLRITVYLMYYDGMTKTNSYNKMFFADTTGTNGVGPIDKTTTLDPKDFDIPADALDVAVNGNSFSMKRAATCPADFTWPDMDVNVKVDLDKVPIFGANVASAETNYKIILTNTATNETINLYSKDVVGHEQSPNDAVGLTEINVKERSGWSGVVNLKVEVYLIYYNGQGTTNRFVKMFFADATGTNGGTADDTPPTDTPVDPDVITKTTTLDPKDFDIPADALDVAVNGNSFSMKRAATCPADFTWPDMDVNVKVDLDKVPIFGANVASAETNYKIILTNTATNETINLYSKDVVGHEQSPNDAVGLTEINVKERSGWSGVVNLKIEVYLIYYNGQGTTNRFVKMFFADATGTNGGTDDDTPPTDTPVGPPVDPDVPDDPTAINKTTILDPNDFTENEGKIILDINYPQFAMTFDPSNQITWPSITMTKKVNLAKVPIMLVNVLDAQDNYRIQVENLTENKTVNFYSMKNDGYEQSPLNPFGATRRNLLDAGFTAGVAELKITIYFNKYKTQPMTNTFGCIAFESLDDPVDTSDQQLTPKDYLKEPTTISPSIFSYDSNALDLTIDGDSFTMQKAENGPVDWPNLEFEVAVDLDAIPYLQIDVGDAEANFSVRMKVKGSDTTYNFYSDQMAYECAPNEAGLKEVNLIDKLGADGIVTLQFQIFIVVVEYDKASVNTFNSIRFSDVPLPKEEDNEDGNDTDQEQEDHTDPWKYGQDPWSAGTVQEGMESITYLSVADKSDTAPSTNVNGIASSVSLFMIGMAILATAVLERKSRKKEAN